MPEFFWFPQPEPWRKTITNFTFRRVICRLPVDVEFGFRADRQAISRPPENVEYSAVKFRAALIWSPMIADGVTVS